MKVVSLAAVTCLFVLAPQRALAFQTALLDPSAGREESGGWVAPVLPNQLRLLALNGPVEGGLNLTVTEFPLESDLTVTLQLEKFAPITADARVRERAILRGRSSNEATRRAECRSERRVCA